MKINKKIPINIDVDEEFCNEECPYFDRWFKTAICWLFPDKDDKGTCLTLDSKYIRFSRCKKCLKEFGNEEGR